MEIFEKRPVNSNLSSGACADHDHSQTEHEHEHTEQEHGHSHSHSHTALLIKEGKRLGRRFKIGLAITLAFVLVEFVAGLFANSLALISDAGHNLSDGLALAFSWVAIILARRAPTSSKTYGFHRAGILAASLNSLTLVLISIFIFYEGVQRLFSPPEVQSWTVVGVAAIALLVNLTIARLLHEWSHGDLNVKSAFLHIITDAAASAGVIVAGVAQALTGWALFDPLISMLIGVLILWSSWGIIKESTNVLLEGIPAGLNMEALLHDLKKLEGVSEVHDLHAWTIGAGVPVLSCHLQMHSASTLQQVTATVHSANRLLERKYQIRHSTIQVECETCEIPCRISE